MNHLPADPFAHPLPYVFPVLFAVFLFIVYLMFYALTHLAPAGRVPAPREIH